MVDEFAAQHPRAAATAHRRTRPGCACCPCSRPPPREPGRAAARRVDVAPRSRLHGRVSGMSSLRGRHGPGHRRCRHDRLDHRRPAARRRRRPRRRPRQPGPRPPGQPRRRPSPSGRVELVEGDIRDRDLVARPDRGQGPGLPPGRHPDHPVRRGAAAGARGAGRRHVQRASRPPPSTASTRSSPPRRRRSTAWPRSSRPASATTTTTTTRSTAPPSRSTRACCAASARCRASTTCVLRYFNVYGPRMDVHGLYTEVLVRWMERIADGKPPLIFGDGAQTMDFVYTADIARANVLAAASDVTEGVYNVASGTETSLLELAEALLRVMGSDLAGRARPRARGQRRRPPARRHRGRASATSASRPRSGSRRGCASSSSGGRRCARRSPPAGRGGALVSRDQRDAAVARRRRRSPRSPR